MKFSQILMSLIGAGVLLAGGAAHAGNFGAQHAKLPCEACHAKSEGETKSAPEVSTCLKCHGSAADVAKRTSRLDAKGLNPHDSYHYRQGLDCLMCHRQHSKSYNLCQECHDFKAHMKDPK